MGVKSTIMLERADAEERFADMLAKYDPMPDELLETLLECFNDFAWGGEGDANYGIIRDA